MKMTINSRKLKRAVTFTRPGNGYVFADLNGESGSMGVQLFLTDGRPVDTTEKAFEQKCRKWFASYIRSI